MGEMGDEKTNKTIRTIGLLALIIVRDNLNGLSVLMS